MDRSLQKCARTRRFLRPRRHCDSLTWACRACGRLHTWLGSRSNIQSDRSVRTFYRAARYVRPLLKFLGVGNERNLHTEKPSMALDEWTYACVVQIRQLAVHEYVLYLDHSPFVCPSRASMPTTLQCTRMWRPGPRTEHVLHQ